MDAQTKPNDRIKPKQLETRGARAKLMPRGRPYCVTIAPGVRLGYRRTRTGNGTYSLVLATGNGAATVTALHVFADDQQDADGSTILTYWDAVKLAQNFGRGRSEAGIGQADNDDATPLTVTGAVANYKADLARRGGHPGNASVLTHHLPTWLKVKLVSLLTKRDIKAFRNHLIDAKLSPGAVNRYMKASCACLQLAATDYPEQIKNATAWQKLRAIPDADRSNNIILNDAQVEAVVHESFELHGERFGIFVQVHAETGARTSQIEWRERNGRIDGLCVDSLHDADTDTPYLLVPSSKKGKNKKIVMIEVEISTDLAAKLVATCTGRGGREPLLLTDKGKPATGDWLRTKVAGRDHDRIALIAASLKLPVSPIDGKPATIYALRHSSVVRGLLNNIPIRVVAVAHDTSVAMIEETYSKDIGKPGRTLMRRALISIGTAKRPANVVAIRKRKAA